MTEWEDVLDSKSSGCNGREGSSPSLRNSSLTFQVIRSGGGIGILKGFKIPRQQCHAGSTPALSNHDEIEFSCHGSQLDNVEYQIKKKPGPISSRGGTGIHA